MKILKTHQEESLTSQKEIFKVIENFPLYEVSDYGRVRSWNGYKTERRSSPKYLTFGIQGKSSNYRRPIVVLVANKKNSTRRVSRLVLEAFGVQRPTNKHVCAHNDGNPENNNINNLRWATLKENSEDSRKHGTRPRGSLNGSSKLTESDIPEIIKLKKGGMSSYALAKQYKVCHTTILNVFNRKQWKHVKV
jgi:hypothetical protein